MNATLNTRYIDAKAHLGYFGKPGCYTSISMKAKAIDTKQDGKRVFIPVDDAEAAQFQVGDNYGNCLFMSRKDGNTLFKALKLNLIDRTLTGWELHHAITRFLSYHGIIYTTGCSRP